MVSSVAPSSAGASSVQLFTGRPSRCTTQAPHWLVSQPIWVPVRWSCSRSSSATSVAGSTSTVVGRPLSVKDICKVILLRDGSLGEWKRAAGGPCGHDDIADGERVRKEGL